MDFEADQIYLGMWHLNRPMFQRGSGGSGRGSRRGSVAAEISAEKEQQQRRIRDQEALLKVVKERERLLSAMQFVPPVFLNLLKAEGKDIGGVKADEVFTVFGLRYENKTLTPEQAETYENWKKNRNITEESLRRMESGRCP